MQVTLQAGSEAKFYDIHHNAVVYIDKLEGDYTPEMHEGNQEGLSKEQLNDIFNATKSLVGKGSNKPKAHKGKEEQPFKPTEATYTYVYQKDKPQAIAMLYSALMGKKWLEEHTKLETFEKLFSGETGAFTIRWNLDTTQLLWYLFKRLKTLNYITRPKGITKWQIEKSHILSKQGRQIDDWHGQHDHTDTTEVDTLVDLLNPQDAILAKSYRQEDRLNGDINRRLARERLMANRHHDDDDD